MNVIRVVMAICLLCVIPTLLMVLGEGQQSSALRWGLQPTAAGPYHAAMRSGLRQLQRGDAQEAVRSFESALRIAPQSPRALAELGRAALAAQDLPRAQQAAERAASLARIPRVQGA